MPPALGPWVLTTRMSGKSTSFSKGRFNYSYIIRFFFLLSFLCFPFFHDEYALFIYFANKLDNLIKLDEIKDKL